MFYILLFSDSQKPIGYDSVRDIFPYITESEIVNALHMSEDIESAVTKLCADQVGGSCYDPLQSSYASMFNDELWELDEIMELSEIQNVHEHEISVDNNEDFNSKLKELSNHSIESGERIRLKVRSCILEDTVAKMKIVRREGLSGLVTVQFIGEPAVDKG